MPNSQDAAQTSSDSPPISFVYTAAAYDGACESPSYDVPIYRATSELLANYGRLVPDYDAEPVARVPWPKTTGWRQLSSGTGFQQGLIEDDFSLRWDAGGLLYGYNVGAGGVGIGFVAGMSEGVGAEGRGYMLVRSCGYHPDGGQVFFSKTGRPFVMLLAPPVGDDIKLEDFAVFWFDGSCGFNIAPNVWHQPPFCADDVSVYRNKQSSVFACVEVDTFEEFGKYLRIPLAL